MYGFNDLLAILLLGGVFYILGFRIVRRTRADDPPQTTGIGQEADQPGPLERRSILLSALNEPPFTEILSPRQRERLRHSLFHPGDTWVESLPVEDFEGNEPSSEALEHLEPFPQSEPSVSSSYVFELTAPHTVPQFEPSPEPAVQAESVSPSTVTVPPAAPKAPRKPMLDSIRASWDPAVMMLYLGALLVVVAGLIFATYNWGTLGGWQKLGLLAAGTAAFLIAGFAIRNIGRVKPASTTFITIGGLLVPANFLAAYTVFDDVQPAMPLFLGAIATTVIHSLLSRQPGARIFRYSAIGASVVAIASVPAAAGIAAGWGGVLGLVVIALLPDHLFGLRSFRQPWLVISRGAAGPLAGFAIWQGWDANGWMVAGALVGLSMVSTRLATSHASVRPYLRIFADVTLILASIQIAYNFDGDRWLIAAGFFALTLILVQEAWYFLRFARWIEFAAVFSSAMFVGEVVRVLGNDTWAIAISAGVLAGLILVHGRRHPSLARISEVVAAFALPISLGTAVYAIDPSLWSGVVGLAAFTLTSIWLGSRRMYPQHWPAGAATVSALGTVIVLAPAIGPDWGWGSVAAVFVVSLAPHPFGKLQSFAHPWFRVGNALVAPLALFALFRGTEVNHWLIPATLVAISLWLTRLSLDVISHTGLLLVLSDAFAVLAAMGVSWILRDDQWLLATALLGLALVLVKRSVTWPSHASALQFVAVIVFAFFAGDVAHELIDPDWALPAGAAVLAIGMLVHARLHPRDAWGSEYIAVWAFPIAIGSGIRAEHDSWWWLSIGAAVLTLTLVLHRIRHRAPGDLNLAIASVSGIVATMIAADLLGFADSSRGQVIVLLMLGIVLTVLANMILPRFTSVSDWVMNLLRIEALPFFYAAEVTDGLNRIPILALVILVLFWNVWSSRQTIWTLPMGLTMWFATVDLLIDPHLGTTGALWTYAALAAIFAAIAWQLDRRTRDHTSALHAGIYMWILVSAVSTVLVLSAYFQAVNEESSIHNGLTLIVAAGLNWIGYRSNGGKVLLLLAGFVGFTGMIAFTFSSVTAIQQMVLAIVTFAVASALYWWTSKERSWIAFVLLGFGLIYIQEATGLTYTQDMLLALVLAWILVSLAIIRWRTDATRWQSNPVFYQAMLLHGLAICLPLLNRSFTHVTRSDVVMVLVSLAGVVATFGAMRRSRGLVLTGSTIGMTALLLQISLGSPGNLQAYTVPLSIYLLAVGLLLRRDPRIANTLLAVGSAILVIPALVEALTTGEIMWLWVALAESMGLFLFGTLLRLRIPTAAGVIAVSVIALRMLVFAVSVVASWISILAIGVTLLLVGTLWLIFRDQIQVQVMSIFTRWRSFD